MRRGGRPVTSNTGAAEGHHVRETPAVSNPGDLEGLTLPQVFSPAEAAAVLRDAGLKEMTECALRTRAYRKQVPFHRNGRRIVFTLSDLRDIAMGAPHTPEPRPEPTTATTTPRAAYRRPRTPRTAATGDLWRARRPGDCRIRAEPSSSRDSHTKAARSAPHHDDSRAGRRGACRSERVPPTLQNGRSHGIGA
jgi:hypothetical protein